MSEEEYEFWMDENRDANKSMTIEEIINCELYDANLCSELCDVSDERDYHKQVVELLKELKNYEELEEQLINHTGCNFKSWIKTTTSIFDDVKINL